MRVLLVSSHGADLSYAGAERYVHDLRDGLRAHGHDVNVLSAFPVRDESARETVVLHGSDWREDRLRRVRNHVDDWLAVPARRLEQTLRSLRPQLVHTNNLPGISTGIWETARRLGVPVAHTLHDYQLLCPRTTLMDSSGGACRPSPLLCGLRTRRLARWSPAVGLVIGVSAYVLSRHADFFGGDTRRVVIRAPSLARTARPTSSPRPVTLGYVGRLVPYKGVGLLLEAAPQLAREGFRVRIAGHGPLAEEVSASPHVEYAGRLDPDGVAEFMASCDLGVVPSLWEEPGLTYVLFEWHAAGRAVIASRHGGLAEAADLGGVASFDGTCPGLIGAVRDSAAPEAWRRLVGSIPEPFGDRGLEGWLEAHLDAYRLLDRRAGATVRGVG